MDERSELTKIHAKVIAALDFLFIDHEDEHLVEIDGEEFQLDCYLPTYHLCIEADGPSHGMRGKKDKRRDALLLSIGVPTFRLRWKLIEHETTRGLAGLIARWCASYAGDVMGRRAQATAKDTVKRVPRMECECPGDCLRHEDIGGL